MLLSAIKHNPIFFLLAILFAVVALVMALIALVAAVKKRTTARPLAIIACVGAILAAGAGVAGWAFIRSQTDDVTSMPQLNHEEKRSIEEQGRAEASAALVWGLGSGALPLLLGAAALVMGARSSPPS